MATPKTGTIALSRRAFLYFFGLYAWGMFKKLFFWVLVLTVAYTSYQLFKSTKVFGASDAEIARAFAAPLPRVAGAFAIFIVSYATIRAIIATRTTNYALTAKGVIVETGWWTRRTIIVDYSQIQKMTIVTNPFDRMFQARYIYLDLIGGTAGVALEAVDADAVANIQGKLSIAAPVTPQLITKPSPVTKKLPAQKLPSTQAKVKSKAKPKPKKSTRAKKTKQLKKK